MHNCIRAMRCRGDLRRGSRGLAINLPTCHGPWTCVGQPCWQASYLTERGEIATRRDRFRSGSGPELCQLSHLTGHPRRHPIDCHAIYGPQGSIKSRARGEKWVLLRWCSSSHVFLDYCSQPCLDRCCQRGHVSRQLRACVRGRAWRIRYAIRPAMNCKGAIVSRGRTGASLDGHVAEEIASLEDGVCGGTPIVAPWCWATTVSAPSTASASTVLALDCQARWRFGCSSDVCPCSQSRPSTFDVPTV